jgi:hypothetical protein
MFGFTSGRWRESVADTATLRSGFFRGNWKSSTFGPQLAAAAMKKRISGFPVVRAMPSKVLRRTPTTP